MQSSSHQPKATFGRVLIANRGEIAIRVVRACRELGMDAIAIYGEGEEDALHVRLAEDAYRIPAGAGIPYLDVAAIVAVAQQAEADAVHPGYGFLAEHAGFAEACGEAGVVFVGPPPAAIRAMGDKVESRRLAAAAGVPIVPGTEEPVASADEALAWARKHGFPVAVKAAGGGGGRGFRVAHSEKELPEAFAGAAGEAERFFANPTVYLERYIERPRHIEVQVFADAHDATVAVGERDCSVQRRHQKLIEEAPAPGIDDGLRRSLAEAATALARAVGYRNAGTVEFLVDAEGQFAFLEMNTRIQVEHPVTEMVTGIDLVKEQLVVAAGAPLSFSAETIAIRGHAIECRINAEDPGRGFAPAPGTIARYREPGGFGIRVDSAMEAGGTVLPAYDSMIAKLIAWGRDRDEAVARMERALADYEIGGVPTTIPFHRAVLAHPVFRAGGVATTFLSEQPEVVPTAAGGDDTAAAPVDEETAPVEEVIAEVNGRRFVVRVHGGAGGGGATARRPPRLAGGQGARQAAARAGADGRELVSPVQGTVVRVVVEQGQAVTGGEVVCVVEAMKMENELVAHREGTVAVLRVGMGDAVKIGDVVAEIEGGE